MMRVLHILGSIERSGAETMLRDAIERFRALDVEIELLSTGETPGRFASAFESVGVRVHHLPFGKTPQFFRRLQALVRLGEYEVVHVHTERGALWIELTSRVAGVGGVVRSVHSAFEFSGLLRLRRALGRWFAVRILGVRHIFVSPSVEMNELERFGTTGVSVLNAIDTNRFVPPEDVGVRNRVREKLGIAIDAVVLLSVGRCTDVKQHDHILKAIALLVGDVPGLHYLHVGDGPNSWGETSLSALLGVADRCRFLGECDDVVCMLQTADIFLMPSRYEGLGIAAIEASACGLPVVAYDVAGLRDAVVSGETGELVEADVVALAQAVKRLALNSNDRVAYGCAGRSMAESRYSLDRWVEQHVVLYEGSRLR